MTDEEKKAIIAEMPIGELKLRRGLINSAIRECLKAGDPLGGAAIYRAQLARIEEELRKKIGRTGNHPVTVHARVARMGAKANKQ